MPSRGFHFRKNIDNKVWKDSQRRAPPRRDFFPFPLDDVPADLLSAGAESSEESVAVSYHEPVRGMTEEELIGLDVESELDAEESLLGPVRGARKSASRPIPSPASPESHGLGLSGPGPFRTCTVLKEATWGLPGSTGLRRVKEASCEEEWRPLGECPPLREPPSLSKASTAAW